MVLFKFTFSFSNFSGGLFSFFSLDLSESFDSFVSFISFVSFVSFSSLLVLFLYPEDFDLLTFFCPSSSFFSSTLLSSFISFSLFSSFVLDCASLFSVSGISFLSISSFFISSFFCSSFFGSSFFFVSSIVFLFGCFWLSWGTLFKKFGIANFLGIYWFSLAFFWLFTDWLKNLSRSLTLIDPLENLFLNFILIVTSISLTILHTKSWNESLTPISLAIIL